MNGGADGLLTFLFAGCAVILMAYGASRLLVRFQVSSQQGRRMRLLEGLSLGRDRGLFLVAVGKQVMVVGSGPGGLQLIQAVTDQEMVKELLEPGEPLPAAAVPVDQAIRANLERMRRLLAEKGGKPDA